LPEAGMAEERLESIGERVLFCARIISKSLE
jgi:hypothetical protein